MLQSQAAIQNAWREINGRGLFFFPSSILEMTSQCEKTVCESAGTCCAVSAFHILQHGAITTEVTNESPTA